jgi:TolB-like protein
VKENEGLVSVGIDHDTAEFAAEALWRWWKKMGRERLDQQGNASEETARKLANETGADFLLTGSVRTIVDQSGRTRTRTYYVTAELTNIESNIRLWLDQNREIKKIIKTPGARL